MIGTLRTARLDPQSSTGLLLWQVTNSWQRAIRAALAPLKLTHVQFVLLAVLAAMDRAKPVTQRDLAESAGTDAMMTSQVLRALESKGLVQRLAHPADGRARTLLLTSTGSELVARAVIVVEEADEVYFSALADARTEFTHALRTLAHTKREG